MDIATPTARRSLREPLSALALFIGGLAWIASFWFPAFYTSQGPVEGYWVFATGWMGFAIFQFAWYANLFILLGIILMYSSPLWGSTLAGFAMLIATQGFWFTSIPTGEVDMPILQLGQGFWCWYGSILLLGVGVFLGSEHTEAEKNQTTKQKRVMARAPKLKKLPAAQPAVLTSTTLVPITAQSAASEPIYETILQPEANLSIVANTTENMPVPTEPEPIQPMPFAKVPEPELPNFAELSAANEQEYFQLADEVALKPAYNEHLAEDWPPKMSLVVTLDPFTTEPHLEAKVLAVKTEDKLATGTTNSTIEPSPSKAGFFDPWKT
ncbi:MAG: hypothetical protein WBP46_05585 [Thiolinea sp.]